MGHSSDLEKICVMIFEIRLEMPLSFCYLRTRQAYTLQDIPAHNFVIDNQSPINHENNLGAWNIKFQIFTNYQFCSNLSLNILGPPRYSSPQTHTWSWSYLGKNRLIWTHFEHALLKSCKMHLMKEWCLYYLKRTLNK